MQGVALLIAAAQFVLMRRVVLLRRCGFRRAARRLYAQAAMALSGLTMLSMLAQEIILWRAGMLTWRTGLPLHLCSAAGVLLPVALLTGQRWLWHITLYLGVPGGLAATLFPSIIATPWPRLTELAFHVLHGCLLTGPLLPLCLEEYPRPVGAAQAALFLAGLAAVDAAVNHFTGSNYLFLNLPAPGTPLDWMARHGVIAYRLWLAGITGAMLAGEAAVVHRLTQRNG